MNTQIEALEVSNAEEVEVELELEPVKEPTEELELEPAKEEEPPKVAKKYSEKTDEELAEYSEGVQKRINKLTRDRHDAGRRADAAEKMRDEAVNFARRQVHTNQQQTEIIKQGEAYLIDQLKGRAGYHIELAQSQLSKAHEDGDTKNIVAAQSNLIQAEAELKSATEHGVDYAARQQPQYPQQQQQYQAPPQPQYQAPQASKASMTWADENPWFTSDEHPDMRALAFGIHEKLIKQGFEPDSNEYFTEIDNSMREHFPKYEGFATKARPPNVVASAGRNAGGKSRTVKLTSTQVDLATQLGLTKEQYAVGVDEERQQGN